MKKVLLLCIGVIIGHLTISAQCLQLQNCLSGTTLQFCDNSGNNSKLWNAPYWLDALYQLHDMPDGTADLSITAKDTCGALTFRYQLMLDLNGDGVVETMVDSKTPPPPGKIYFNNINTPNGTLRTFDTHTQFSGLLYRFGLEVIGSGDTRTARVRWRTQGVVGNYSVPQLPHGVHQIKWIVEDNAGNTATCSYSFEIKDCKKPAVQCLGDLSAFFLPNGYITVYASDVLASVSDNLTPLNKIKLGIKKAGASLGFPLDANGQPIGSVTFECAEQGLQTVELWAMDLKGNTDHCTLNLTLTNTLGGGCDTTFNGGPVACAKTFGGDGIDEVQFSFEGIGPGVPSFVYDWLGCLPGQYLNLFPSSSDIKIKCVKDDNPLNGVSQFDMVLIAQQIADSNSFSHPWQWVAADANRDNIIDSLDILECRKLILGIYNELPNNGSWRFVRGDYVFPEPNPLSQPIADFITVAELAVLDSMGQTPFIFKGVKVCDVNGTAVINNQNGEATDRDFIPVQFETTSFLPAQPNPTTAGVSIPAWLETAGKAMVQVVDLNGRILYRATQMLESGGQMLDIPASALPAPGLYAWQVRVNGQVFSGKIMKSE